MLVTWKCFLKSLCWKMTKNSRENIMLESIAYRNISCAGFLPLYSRVHSLAVTDLCSETKGSRLESGCNHLSAAITKLTSKCLWSRYKWQRGVKEIAFPFSFLSCESQMFVKENLHKKNVRTSENGTPGAYLQLSNICNGAFSEIS